MFHLTPGRYQVWGGGMLLDVAATELTVASGDGDVEMLIKAH